MLSVTSDITSSTAFQPPRQTAVRDDQVTGPDSFGSLVDRSTAADTSSERAPSALPDWSAPTPAPARRADDQSSTSNAPSARADDSTDDTNAAKASESSTAADAAEDTATAAASTDLDNPKTVKSAKESGKKTETKSGKDAVKEAAISDDSKLPTTNPTPTDKAAGAAVTVNAAAIAIVIPAATASIAPAPAPAATTPAAGGTQPLAIAAAVIKAQAAAIETGASAATSVAGTAEGKTVTSADAGTTADQQQFAALIASATPAAGKTGLKQAGKTIETATPVGDVTKDAKAANAGSADITATTAGASKTAAPTSDGSTTAKGKSTDTTSDPPAKSDVTATDAVAAQPAAASPHPHQAADAAAVLPAAQPDLTASISGTLQQQPLLQAATAVAPALPPALTATVATSAPVPLNGLAVEIAASAQSGKSSFDIRLDPAELGRIDVRLDVDKQGQVTSHLTVEKPETLAMLRQDAPQLQRALEQAGLKTGDGGLQFSLRDQSSSGQQNNGNESGRNAQRLIVSEDETVPAVTAGRSYGRMPGSNSGVDIRI